MTRLTCASPGSAPPSWQPSPASRPRPAPRMTSWPPCSAARPPRGRPRPQGPKAEGKTLFASARKPIADIIKDAFAEAGRRDPGHARPWIAVVDGNNTQIAAITGLAAQHQVKVPNPHRPDPHHPLPLESRAQLLLPRRSRSPRLGPRPDGKDPGREAPRRPRRDPPPRHRLRLQPRRARRRRRVHPLPGKQAGLPRLPRLPQGRMACRQHGDFDEYFDFPLIPQ